MENRGHKIKIYKSNGKIERVEFDDKPIVGLKDLKINIHYGLKENVCESIVFEVGNLQSLEIIGD